MFAGGTKKFLDNTDEGCYYYQALNMREWWNWQTR